MIAAAKRTLRKFAAHPHLYALARRAMLLGQYALRRPDEPDLRGFVAFRKQNGLVVDIGANGGQSAIALAFLLPGYEIVSFEPNPALWRELDFVGRVLGARFSYRKLGLGAQHGVMTLHVPELGRLPITTRASLSLVDAEAHAVHLAAESGRAVRIAAVSVDVVPFDALGLAPDFVKIDVEGYELAVLEGMVETLRRCRPVIMAEANPRDAECRRLLEGIGYRIAWFDCACGTMTEVPPAGAGNWFALPSPG